MVDTSDERKAQIELLAAVVVGVIPQAKSAAAGWADKLYDLGMRIQGAPAATLKAMAARYPFLAPALEKVETAVTASDRIVALRELSALVTAESLLGADREFGELSGDNPE